MTVTRVAIVGAAGETGTSIVNGLIEAGGFSIVALTRPSSIDKPANAELKKRGVEVVAADLSGSEDRLVSALDGVDVVVSAIGPHEQYAQIALANAAKTAGVKRFLPCGFITVAPPGGIMTLRDWKEDVYNHIKQIKLPYTIVDVGWWYQISIPRLPSGKVDYVGAGLFNTLVVDGNTPSALTDVRDIGKHIAAIIVDSRTLNKYVLAYNEVWTPNDVHNKLEELSGEKIPREYIAESQLRKQLADANEGLKKDSTNYGLSLAKIGAEYQISWGVRGDNTPEHARYLGYLTSSDLYPDLKLKSFESYLKDLLEGKGTGVYQNNDAILETRRKIEQEAAVSG